MDHKEIFRSIDALYQRYLDVLEDICNIESPTLFKKGVDKVSDYISELAEGMGFSVERRREECSGDALCITLSGKGEGAPICLSAHIDTVHPVGSFGSPAVHRDDEYMYGPGVVDCKGGIAAALLAMDALRMCGYNGAPIKLIVQSDEENSSITSGKDTVRYMCECAKGAAAFLNLEGIKQNRAVLSRKGIIRYKYTVHGRACHSSVCYNGANAVAEAAYKIIELEKMKDEKGITCNCGVISGGTVSNVVADKCEFFADIRFATGDEYEFVIKETERIRATSFVKGCTAELQVVSERPAMELTDKNIALLAKMNEAFLEYSLPILEGGHEKGGSDAAYITECGIPCVDSLGVEGVGIHTVGERMRLCSLAESAKRIAAVACCMG